MGRPIEVDRLHHSLPGIGWPDGPANRSGSITSFIAHSASCWPGIGWPDGPANQSRSFTLFIADIADELTFSFILTLLITQLCPFLMHFGYCFFALAFSSPFLHLSYHPHLRFPSVSFNQVSRPSIMSDENAARPRLPLDAVIRYDETWQVSVCTKCKIGVHSGTLRRHLMGKHHHYRKPDWGPILDALKDLPQPESTDSFPHPPNGIAPIPDLKIWDGFVCNLCGYIITSREVMHSKHWKVHNNVVHRTEMFYRPVKVQVITHSYDD